MSTLGATAAQRPTSLHRALFQSIGDDSRPAQVERRLAQAIMVGVLRAGERLPSENELAQAFGVSATTIREALTALRGRELIVTVRGRRGGSYVHDSADPIVFARRALQDTTLVALRDLGAHHATIAAGCARLAARRAGEAEAQALRERLSGLSEEDLGAWRRGLDELLVEIAALGQSPRLTRELMQRQLELSPYLRLLDAEEPARREQREALAGLLEAIREGDGHTAAERCEQLVRDAVERLVRLRGRSR